MQAYIGSLKRSAGRKCGLSQRVSGVSRIGAEPQSRMFRRLKSFELPVSAGSGKAGVKRLKRVDVVWCRTMMRRCNSGPMQAASGAWLFVKRHSGPSESAIGSHSFDWDIRDAWLFNRDRATLRTPCWSLSLTCNPPLVWTRVRSRRGISLTLALTRLMAARGCDGGQL
jgi:hypothetical protein